MSEKGGSALLVAPLTPSHPLELLESPTVRRLSNNFRGGGAPPKKKLLESPFLLGISDPQSSGLSSLKGGTKPGGGG